MYKSDEGYARCKACDRQFYPRWIDETKPCGTRVQMFEELCWKCLGIATQTANIDRMLFGEEAWDGTPSDDDRFLEGYVMDKQLDRVDYNDPDYNDNRYYENGGGFGDAGLFDSYE